MPSVVLHSWADCTFSGKENMPGRQSEAIRFRFQVDQTNSKMLTLNSKLSSRVSLLLGMWISVLI